MAVRILYLQLPPELGGIRFGPFPGTCIIGSDPKRAQLHLDPSLGVYPIHATVTHTAVGRFTVAPASKECKLFLMPVGQMHTWPINGPVQASVGDLLIIGTPTGPRFQLLSEQPIAAAPTAASIVQTARATGGEQGLIQGASELIDGVFRPSGSGVVGEINRQLMARALARSGPTRTLYNLWTRVRTGQLFTPSFIVAVGLALVGAIGTGSVSCSGLLYVLYHALGLR
jgi:hypothetical protein